MQLLRLNSSTSTTPLLTQPPHCLSAYSLAGCYDLQHRKNGFTQRRGSAHALALNATLSETIEPIRAAPLSEPLNSIYHSLAKEAARANNTFRAQLPKTRFYPCSFCNLSQTSFRS